MASGKARRVAGIWGSARGLGVKKVLRPVRPLIALRIRGGGTPAVKKRLLDLLPILFARLGAILRVRLILRPRLRRPRVRLRLAMPLASNGVATIIPSFVSMFMQLMFAIAVLALISPPMVALFAAAALLSFVLARTLRGRLKALHKTVQEKEGAVRVFLQEALEHQLVIRSFGAQPATSARADKLQEEHFVAQMRRRGYSIAANASFSFFFNALYAVALTWCAFELLHGTMSYGTLMAVLQLVARIQAPVSSLSGMLPQLYQSLASAERLMEVANLPQAQDCLPGTAAEFYELFSGVRLTDLVFSYDDGGGEDAAGVAGDGEAADAAGAGAGAVADVSADGENAVGAVASIGCGDVVGDGESEAADVSEAADKGGRAVGPAFEDVGLTCENAFVPKGSFVVVEGPSGSGKSTLFKLVLGAYDADGFTYELANGARAAASQVPPGVFAYVPQDNFLFAGTVRENVAFAAPNATDDQVKRACEIACAWDFVEELPLGLGTMIGEHGQGLSQGQLQRLAIARAVCSGAPIMVLDEVTSALDNATEAAVLANIAQLPGKTVFVAAHRAKAREFATMRLHVENGVLSEVC